MQTNFQDVDFPAGSVSPGQKVSTPSGWTLTWTFANLLSGQSIGMTMPQKLNPGPFAARVTFFAPVSLPFFLTVMVILGATSGPSLHPMHYWFIAAAFFAFHLLLAYLVDHISVHLAFGVAAAVSLALVVSYLRLVTGMRHALLQTGADQYGVRTSLRTGDIDNKLEIVLEARIDFESPSADDAVCGVKTLALRMQRHCESALELARWLEAQPQVERVHYPGLASHPQHDRAKTLFRASSGLFSFELADGIDCFDFLNRLQVVVSSSNLGDNRTLAIPVAHTIYFEMGPERRASMGFADSLIRISTGIEDIDDLIADFRGALG